MTLLDDRLAREILMQVRRHYLELATALGEINNQEDLDSTSAAGTLQHDLKLLIEVANGEYLRTEEIISQVEPALSRLMEVLLGNALRSKAIIPDDFWQTNTGILVSRVRWWLSVDDLITISNAAALAFGENTQANRMRIARAMDKGLLDWVPDPSVANPQQNRRVLRPQVERLRDLSRLPE